MRKLLTILKTIAFTFIYIILLTITWCSYLYYTADMKEPVLTVSNELPLKDYGTYRQYGDNYLRRSKSGLWEMKIKGGDFERGVAAGKLTDSLLYFQEKVFVDQIKEMIPSESYLKFLRFFLIMFNRDLGNNVIEEYRNEIYGISLMCTDEYNFIGNPYERQLNYHAAHDMGHTMQDYMLVGCSSFAAWNGYSEDSTMVIGRNFDFYVGDKFAENKLVMFCEPDNGYKFVSVTWAGMIGVLSGMNEKGLTVTINAAKSSIPTSTATPISLLTREILQYASTIEEAYEIAKKRNTFVSESILVGSAKDRRAAIIEKSPDNIGIYEPTDSRVICTNHFQSAAFENDERNIENIKTSDSYYRYQRLEELLNREGKINHNNAASILRNRLGLNDAEVGLSNEMALNQSIAHHAVIFKPEELKIWVSTSPWQSGKFVVYDLNKVFNDSVDFAEELYVEELEIAADSAFLNIDYKNLIEYRDLAKTLKDCTKQQQTLSAGVINSFKASNPEYYHMHELLGDYYKAVNNLQSAKDCWQQALTKAIPKLAEKQRIEKKLAKLKI